LNTGSRAGLCSSGRGGAGSPDQGEGGDSSKYETGMAPI
jgi:hypothetical protein